MSVTVEHIPARIEEHTMVVADPSDVDGEVISCSEVENERQEAYVVTYKLEVMEEQYVVTTRDGTGSESRTYYITEDDNGDWGVDKLRVKPNRGHSTVKKRGQLSTPTVRKALAEHGVEVVN